MMHSSGTLELRPYRDEDLAAVMRVWEASARHAYPFLHESFFEVGRREIGDVFMPAATTTVALSEGELIGFIALVDHEVGGLFVHPSRIGTGVGRALLEEAARDAGTLTLTVFTKNALGRRFYERTGFTECGPRETEPRSGEELVRMCRERTPV